MKGGLAILGLLLLAALRASASGWEKLDSVHFNGARIDFGMVPRRAVVWYEHTDRPAERGGGDESGENQYARYQLSQELDEERFNWKTKLNGILSHRISLAEQRGDWKAEIRILKERARRLGWTGDIRDRDEVLSAFMALRAAARKPLIPALRSYLGALAAAEAGQRDRAEHAFSGVAADPKAGFLIEHALYQLASLRFEAHDYVAAISGYQAELKRYPRGRKAEAALIMIGRCSIIPAQIAGDAIAGSNAIRRLLNEFPHTRFRDRAIGLAGRLHMLAKRYPQAAWCYLTVGDIASVETVRKQMPVSQTGRLRVLLFAAYLNRMESAQRYYVFEQALYGLDRLTKQLTSTDAFRLNVLLASEPKTASAYLDYRLYHCHNTPRQLNNLAVLGEKIARMHQWRSLPPDVRVRLAELLYAHREYAKAIEWANRASERGDWDRTLFVRGAAMHKQHKTEPAIQQFRMLESKFPNSSLMHGAREELALLYEDNRDLVSALKEYFRLGYKGDVAYLVDAKMSIPELERYFRTMAGSPHPTWTLHSRWDGWDVEPGTKQKQYFETDLIAYSIGIRYMRKERWREAAGWFRRVPRKAYLAFNVGRRNYEGSPPDPLTAIREMSRLQSIARTVKSSNRKADVEYQYASYYYKHGPLLLYNAAVWQHDRMMNFSYFWNPGTASSADEAATRDHMYEHDVYARSLALLQANRPEVSEVASRP